jgi:hypothetical protein
VPFLILLFLGRKNSAMVISLNEMCGGDSAARAQAQYRLSFDSC